jgi:hypothetical protein
VTFKEPDTPLEPSAQVKPVEKKVHAPIVAPGLDRSTMLSIFFLNAASVGRRVDLVVDLLMPIKLSCVSTFHNLAVRYFCHALVVIVIVATNLTVAVRVEHTGLV